MRKNAAKGVWVLRTKHRNSFFCLHRSRKAQALLEAASVLVLFSFICFGMMQVMLKLNAEQVNDWGTYGSSRARIVGYGDAGVQKMYLVGNILNSGKMYEPTSGLPAVSQSSYEMDFIPRYLGPGPVYNNQNLDYDRWPELPIMTPSTSADQFIGSSEQEYPLEIAGLIPLLETSFGTSTATLKTEVQLENHFPFYLEVY